MRGVLLRSFAWPPTTVDGNLASGRIPLRVSLRLSSYRHHQQRPDAGQRDESGCPCASTLTSLGAPFTITPSQQQLSPITTEFINVDHGVRRSANRGSARLAAYFIDLRCARKLRRPYGA